jgi:predicted nucleic acid-binding protein
MGRNLVIYIDTCVYGRRFDTPQTPKIRAETKAIKAILKKCKVGGHRIVGSVFVSIEIGQITDAALRATVKTYFDEIGAELVSTATVIARANFFTAQGCGTMDARHLATAEAAGADFLLTVDKAFARICTEKNLSNVKVINPTDLINGEYLK